MPELTTGLGGLLLWAVIGYLLGSVPYGMIVAKALNLGNLRDIGSQMFCAQATRRRQR